MSDSEKLAEAIIIFTSGLEALAVQLRRQVQTITKAEAKATVSEERFDVLKWQDERGSRLGNYQAAHQSHNLPENWSHAYAILKANNSLTSTPFKEEGYAFRYWIYPEKYPDRIFRKKLNESEAKA